MDLWANSEFGGCLEPNLSLEKLAADDNSPSMTNA